MRRAIPACLAALLVLSLGACGKKGTLRAPDDAEAAYTYPRPYPNPATVVPEAGPVPEPEARPRTRVVPEGAGDITVLPNLRRTKTTYGFPAPQ